MGIVESAVERIVPPLSALLQKPLHLVDGVFRRRQRWLRHSILISASLARIVRRITARRCGTPPAERSLSRLFGWPKRVSKSSVLSSG